MDQKGHRDHPEILDEELTPYEPQTTPEEADADRQAKRKANVTKAGEAKKKAKAKTSKEDKSEKVNVFADTPWDEVLHYDQQGKVLVYRERNGFFPVLDDEQLSELSEFNRQRYYVVRESFESAEDDDMEEIQRLIAVGKSGMAASARERLKVYNKQPEFAYAWQAPHDVFRARTEGWVVVRKGPEETMFQCADGIHRIGDKGSEELVLMKRPKELEEEDKRLRQEAYEKQKGVARRQIEEARASGGITPYMEDEDLERRKNYRFKDLKTRG